MNGSKDIFLDKNLKYGGFYELAIQVCPSIDNYPVRLYTDFIWGLENVEGPYDESFNPISTDMKNFQHRGIMRLGKYSIPFITYNIRETEPIETRFNWFDICFYTATVEKVFGKEYNTWVENPKVPQEITDFLIETVKKLFIIYPFKLAMLGFEVSGRYYLDDLETPLDTYGTNLTFYLGECNYKEVSIQNKKLVIKIEEL
ncbi:MAG TPA: hypothetical protein VK796_09920 [Cytophaga sp.]|jgi:hypothetical protein|nr:hypothetical protein [Cytophaga sp.]